MRPSVGLYAGFLDHLAPAHDFRLDVVRGARRWLGDHIESQAGDAFLDVGALQDPLQRLKQPVRLRTRLPTEIMSIGVPTTCLRCLLPCSCQRQVKANGAYLSRKQPTT